MSFEIIEYMKESVTARHGHQAPASPITVREDAPAELQEAILMLSRSVGMAPHSLREIICDAMLVLPNAFHSRPLK